MPRFRYRMQNILDIKLKLEEQAKIAYGLAEQRYQAEQSKLQEMLVRRSGYEAELKSCMDGRMDLQKIHEARSACDAMKILIRRQMMEVHKKELELEAARSALMDVRKERMMHEKLREKALEKYKKEELDREGKEVDQLVSYTYNPK